MSKLPWMKFFPMDWLTDTAKQKLSYEGRGFWIDLICYLWLSDTRGKIILTYKEISNMMKVSLVSAKKHIAELKSTKTANIRIRNDKITIINRRMEREEYQRTSAARRAKTFRDKGGGDPDRWNAIRIDILRRDNYMCAYCGKKATTVDHIIPRLIGGNEDYSNLVACCKSCNSIKATRTIQDADLEYWDGFDQKKLKSNTNITPQKLEVRSQKSEKNTTTVPAEAIKLTNMFLDMRMIDKELTVKETDTWFREIWKLNRIDNESWEVIESVIRWVLNDEFWRTNCHSPLKFRRSKDGTRYWDLFKALSSKSGIRDQIVGETEYGKNEL